MPKSTNSTPKADGNAKRAAKAPSRRAATTKRRSADKRSAAVATVRPGTKIARLIELLSRKDGATIAELAKATGWQPHSVRGAISGNLKKKLGLNVVSEVIDGRGRVYRIARR